MKPAPFDYFAPNTADQVLELLEKHGDAAKVLAGGQSLIPLMAFRLVRPAVLVDLRSVDSLSSLEIVDDVVTIGSMVTHRTVENHPILASRCGLLADALPVVGHVAIRNVGTVGGSLAHADPAAEWPTVAVSLGAEMAIRGSRGTRVVAAEDFFTGWMTSDLNRSEILDAVRFKLPGPGTGSAFVEVARRHGDFAIVGAAAVVTVANGAVADARITLAGAAMTPVRAQAAEAALVGRPVSPESLTEAAEAAGAAADPVADLHATQDYKRHLASVLTKRAIQIAHRRALEAA